VTWRRRDGRFVAGGQLSSTVMMKIATTATFDDHSQHYSTDDGRRRYHYGNDH